MQQTYSYQPSHQHHAPEPPRKPRRVLRIMLVIIVLMLSGATSFLLLKAMGGVVAEVSHPTETKTPEPEPAPLPSIVLTDNAEINEIIAAHPDIKIGVGIQDITTGEHKAYGVSTPFTAASTGKLLTAAAYYHDVELGKESLETVLGTRSAQEHLRLMINQSNNDSWEILELHLGLQHITDYAASINVDYVTRGNTISPGSMASFLSELYNGKLLNEAHTQQLLGYMQNTNWETLIPPVVPEGITVYHKYGLLNWVIHDVAILVKGDKAYALAVYTEGADYTSNTERSEMIQAVTKAAISQLFSSE